MSERGFLAAWRFYRANFRRIFVLSFVFYVALVAICVVSVYLVGYAAIIIIVYVAVASIFWLQAPLVPLVDDRRHGRPPVGVRATFRRLYPRMGPITSATALAAFGIYFAGLFFLLPGLLLLARWALVIPVIVLEDSSALAGFRRSNRLVRRHTGRVVLELIGSGVLLAVMWVIAFVLLAVPFAGPVLFLAFLAAATPPIPLMRISSYYDLAAVSSPA
jgi:hypothetical protein